MTRDNTIWYPLAFGYMPGTYGRDCLGCGAPFEGSEKSCYCASCALSNAVQFMNERGLNKARYPMEGYDPSVSRQSTHTPANNDCHGDQNRKTASTPLRDYFAGQVLAGCLQGSSGHLLLLDGCGYGDPDQVAAGFYRIADAMIKARGHK